MNSFVKNTLAFAAALLLAAPLNLHATAITFDDFNVDRGHFNTAPSFAGQSNGIHPDSTAERVITDDPLEGSGHLKLVLIYTGEGNLFRTRFLSGVGNPANNIPFTTTDGVDGNIGYYVRTTASGWETSINLDGPGNTIAEMAGSTSLPLIADGEWHLYEWDLDSTTDWGPVPGIGGGHGGHLPDGTWTIDSIWFRYMGELSAEVPDAEIFLDFVALNREGSVADLLENPCINTSGVLVQGPLSTDSAVVVAGVSADATEITIYQNTGSGMAPLGSTTSDITEGDNLVAVSGLVKDAQVAATQTVNDQESCVPPTGVFVGGGANPSIRVALSIRETSSTGPIGAPGDITTGPFRNIHFLGAATVQGGAPVDARVIEPSTEWQTITFDPAQTVEDVDPTHVGVEVVGGQGYAPEDWVILRIYASKIVGDATIFSELPAETWYASSPDGEPFAVNWSWAAVEGADGYRLLRSLNFDDYNHYVDVTETTFGDTNTEWTEGDTVTPNAWPPSIQWNPAVGNPNNIETPWGTLESINLVIDDPEDTGPFDIFIDSIQNGGVVFQDFEDAEAGDTDHGFRVPRFSGSTSSHVLTSPNVGAVSDVVADTGTKSFRVRFQWVGGSATRWLRLTTNGVGDPLVDLSQPISFRMLLLPVGAELPDLPVISIHQENGNVILTWEGEATLQAADVVTGPYEDVLDDESPAESPFTVSPTAAAQFYQLKR